MTTCNWTVRLGVSEDTLQRHSIGSRSFSHATEVDQWCQPVPFGAGNQPLTPPDTASDCALTDILDMDEPGFAGVMPRTSGPLEQSRLDGHPMPAVSHAWPLNFARMDSLESHTIDCSPWDSESHVPVELNVSPVLSYQSQSSRTIHSFSDQDASVLPPLDLSFLDANADTRACFMPFGVVDRLPQFADQSLAYPTKETDFANSRNPTPGHVFPLPSHDVLQPGFPMENGQSLFLLDSGMCDIAGLDPEFPGPCDPSQIAPCSPGPSSSMLRYQIYENSVVKVSDEHRRSSSIGPCQMDIHHPLITPSASSLLPTHSVNSSGSSGSPTAVRLASATLNLFPSTTSQSAEDSSAAFTGIAASVQGDPGPPPMLAPSTLREATSTLGVEHRGQYIPNEGKQTRSDIILDSTANRDPYILGNQSSAIPRSTLHNSGPRDDGSCSSHAAHLNTPIAIETLHLPVRKNAMNLSLGFAASAGEGDEGRHRSHPLYSNGPHADGLYHCPFESENCQHKPDKLKCNYDKFVDSHLKPFRCKNEKCSQQEFSSTACLLRHEREAHGLHGHGTRPNLCIYQGCDRGIPGHGFPRRYNLFDHMRRVHDHKDDSDCLLDGAGKPPERRVGGRKRKASTTTQIMSDSKAARINRQPRRATSIYSSRHMSEQDRFDSISASKPSHRQDGDDIQVGSHAQWTAQHHVHAQQATSSHGFKRNTGPQPNSQTNTEFYR